MKKETEEGPREILEQAIKLNNKGEKVIDSAKLREYERHRL